MKPCFHIVILPLKTERVANALHLNVRTSVCVVTRLPNNRALFIHQSQRCANLVTLVEVASLILHQQDWRMTIGQIKIPTVLSVVILAKPLCHYDALMHLYCPCFNASRTSWGVGGGNTTPLSSSKAFALCISSLNLKPGFLRLFAKLVSTACASVIPILFGLL